MYGRLEWPDPTPDGPTPEQEAMMDAERECATCGGCGRIEIWHCDGPCECGFCPDGHDDCPECCGRVECDDDVHAETERQLVAGLDTLATR